MENINICPHESKLPSNSCGPANIEQHNLCKPTTYHNAHIGLFVCE
jgi:hypothetical protein